MNDVIENILWVEKYRPRKVEDCILPKRTKENVISLVSSKSVPNLLLHGPAGTGKTTLAKALCEELEYDWIMINGSNEGRLIDTIRTKIVNFASTVSFSGNRKIVILDEADYSNSDSVQPALRNLIEEYSSNCGFIFTCNFPNKIIEPLHSRLSAIDFSIPNDEKVDLMKEIAKRSIQILKQENVDFVPKAIVDICSKFFPDFRRIINTLQKYSATGKIDEGILSNKFSDDINVLIGYLKEKNFGEIRKWVASTSNLDIASISRRLYDLSYDFVKKESIPQLILILADYSFKDSFAADKEINIVAMLVQILLEVEFV